MCIYIINKYINIYLYNIGKYIIYRIHKIIQIFRYTHKYLCRNIKQCFY